ncbi:MAG TPA: membrane protein insertase YidC, partial [Sphingobacteriaceae bacterium]|nr:membrane protein insertase YidC [Sphingobacteriaceae bacterium]
MDKKTFTGLFLMLIVIVGSVFLMRPSEEEIQKERALQDSIAQARNISIDTPASSSLDTSATSSSAQELDSIALSGPFGGAKAAQQEIVTLENELIKVNISNKGGKVESVELKGHETYGGDPLILFDETGNQFGLLFSTAGININTNDLYFQTIGQSTQVSQNDSTSVSFRLTYAEGKYIDYIYSLKGDSYNLGFTILTKGMQDVVAPNQNQLVLNWEATLFQKEKDLSGEQRYSTAYYEDVEENIEDLSTSKDEKQELPQTKWISFKQHYFSNVLIAKDSFNGGNIEVKTSSQPNVVKTFAANLNLDFDRQDVNSYPMEFFFGPNKFSILKDQGYELEKQINLGWGPMKWINRFVTLPVFNFLEDFNWSYGLIILVLTLLLKLVLSPLSYKSYVSMAKMRVLKPEMDEIKAKVGDDNATLLQQEYMKLYKQAGVNPMGGCIPMLLQMPFTIAFFFFFPNLFELRGESFLWMTDLSTYDSILNFPPIFGIGHISLMCILMTLATLLSTWYNNSVSGVTGQMKYIGYAMPIMFFFVLNSFPAGLTYYYFLSSVLT